MKQQELATALRDNGLIGQVIDLPDAALRDWIDNLSFQINAARNVEYLRRRYGNECLAREASATSSATSSEVAA